MSPQFGIWNFDNRPVEAAYLQEAKNFLVPQGPDGQTTYVSDNIGIAYSAFNTTRESGREVQPHLTASRHVITWDGRLDNRDELAKDLAEPPIGNVPDVALVASSFERWELRCFARLRGDWALSVWSPADKRLLLATDYMGIRPLYFCLSRHAVVWCTLLRPLVALCRSSLTIDDEYIAGYLALSPAAHLTPYREILAVSPGCFVSIRHATAATHRYWDFQPRRRIEYKTDAEYEDHFRYVFRQAVARRLRSGSPILAELSGGLDSSSIVCMADDIIAMGEVGPAQVDTVSYYDPAEPASDERPYIAHVEHKRGRKGHHIDTRQYGGAFSFDYQGLVVVPGANGTTQGVRGALLDLMQREKYRVVLSGSAGDEFLGGVPNPIPQLADLLVSVQPIKFAKELAAWSLIKKRPWIHLFWDALVFILPLTLRSTLAKDTEVAAWIDASFAKRHRIALRHLGPQGSYGFWQPSRRDRARTLVAMRRQMAHSNGYAGGLEDRRYPYLDQNLMEFLLSIPAQQLLRPGQRRSLMRRALSALVPGEILSRRSKGSVARSALATIETNWPELQQFLISPLSVTAGYVNGPLFEQSMRAATAGDAPRLVDLMKTVHLEAWLRNLAENHVLLFWCKPLTSMSGDVAKQN